MSPQKCQCTLCKYYGNFNGYSDTYQEKVFDEAGRSIVVNLCRSHAIELFRLGQKNFFLRHYKITTDVIGTNDSAFLNLMIKTVHKFKDAVY